MKFLNVKKSFLIVGSVLLMCLTVNVFKSCNNGADNRPKKFKSNKNLNISKWDYDHKENNSKATYSQWSTLEKNVFSVGPAFTVHNKTDWKRINMNILPARKIMDYLLWTNQSSCRIVQYFGGIMVSSASGLVSLEGQKALCLDFLIRPFSAIQGLPRRCIVYSFGINNEWSFDEAMELYGCEVFCFDPSMNVSNYNRTKNIHFYQMALGNLNKDGWEKSLGIPTRTLYSIYDMLKPFHGGDALIDYLKIDIETTEWQILPEIISSGIMDKVRQLAVEIHVDFNESIELCREQAGILQSVENYGMVRFDSKPNMNTLTNSTNLMNRTWVFQGYEIAWYNSKLLRDLD